MLGCVHLKVGQFSFVLKESDLDLFLLKYAQYIRLTQLDVSLNPFFALEIKLNIQIQQSIYNRWSVCLSVTKFSG